MEAADRRCQALSRPVGSYRPAEPASRQPQLWEGDMHSRDLTGTAPPRYGFDPKLPFAATLAGAKRRRDAAVAAARVRRRRRSPWRLIRSFGLQPR
jgi:hypothetical protein